MSRAFMEASGCLRRVGLSSPLSKVPFPLLALDSALSSLHGWATLSASVRLTPPDPRVEHLKTPVSPFAAGRVGHFGTSGPPCDGLLLAAP